MIEFYTKLYPHQQAAVDKLRRLKVGALYMEMGTGKTRTSLELIAERLKSGKVEYVIWLCPFSAKENIRIDIKKHCNLCELNAITIVGIETLSTSVRENTRLLNIASNKKTFLVIDESNMVKNPQALRTKHITLLAEKCPYRLILNGTPISRCEADLYAQWYLLDWRILGYKSFYSFAANHLEYDDKFRNKIRRVLNTSYLTDKISPYSVQVKKEDCLNLPEKSYDGNSFCVTWSQHLHYKEIAGSYLSDEVIGTEYESIAVYRTLNALQQVCSGRLVSGDWRKPTVHEPFFSKPEDNPRIEKMQEYVEHLEKGEKAVIWCIFQHEIDDVIYTLTKNGYSCVEFTGRIPKSKRQESIIKFQNEAQFFVSNITCGQYSLNLQFAHRALYYNNRWDWAARAQSEDRIHRIGTNQTVFIDDLYSDEPIDGRVLICLNRKESLAEKFKEKLKSKNYKKWLTELGEEDLLDINRSNRTAEIAGDKEVCQGE